MNDSQFKEILQRLDAITRILVLNLPEEIDQAQKIIVLSEGGLQPKDITKILGTTPNAIRIALHRAKKKSV